MLLVFYRTVKFLVRHVVPPFLRYPLARFCGRLTLFLNPARRRVIVGNLTPLLGEAGARARAPELLGNFLMTSVDFFCQGPHLARSTPLDESGLKKTWEASGRRLMIVTAHMGHWELGVSCLVERGFPVATVYAPYREDAVVEWIMSHRNPRVEWIAAQSGAVEASVSALERGKILCMAGDWPFGEKGHSVSIAGHTARLPIGPWAIAVQARATVVSGFIIRESPGHYRCIFEKPLNPEPGSLTQQITRRQNAYRDHLERYLKTYPTQWGLLTPFWDS